MTAKKKRPDLATLLHTKPSVVTEYLAKHGRKGDKFLAHINKREAAMLKASGGSGTINPKTGIMEFQDEGGFGEPFQDLGTPNVEAINPPAESGFYGGGGYTAAEYAPPAPDAGGFNVGDLNLGATYGGYPTTSGTAQYGQPPIQPTAPAFGISAAPVGGVPQVPPDVATALEGRTAEEPKKPDWIERNKGWALPAALGLLGGGAGLYQNRQMQQQAKGVQGQYAGLAAPYQQQGKELLALTQSGGLTPANAQILEAARAQSAQNVQARGGVGQGQETQRLANIAASLQQQQLTYAYQMMGIGDTIAAKGIEAGLAADQRARAANQQFYGTLASMLSRMQF